MWQRWIGVTTCVLLLTACKSPEPTHDPTPPAMAEDRIFDVQARIASILQQDISKVKGKVNLHTYLGLEILSSRNLADPNRSLAAKRVNLSRPAEEEDRDLRVGDTVRIELGVDRLENPSVYHWMRRVE